MDVYLPIANLSVDGFVIVALGALTGILSGLFGVGGGFLTTPLLIFYGIPPTVAAASAATQVTGASVSGVLAHTKHDGVDYRMGGVLVGGGILGAIFGRTVIPVLPVGRPDRYRHQRALRADAGHDRRPDVAGIAGVHCGPQAGPETCRAAAAASPAGCGLALSLALLSLRPVHFAAGTADPRHADRHSDHADGRGRRLHAGTCHAIYSGNERAGRGRHEPATTSCS